jgi:glycosyltransferase involved in cell wall biosynthesis
MIVNIICSYNELRYLPKVVRYYQNQGVEVYVADNKSADGTWEWLNDNKIPCEQFDTDGCFDLVAQQKLRLKLAKKFSDADWIIYGDADEFIVSRKKITDIINFNSVRKSASNLLRMPSLNLKNTGETTKNDPTTNYFYYAEREHSNEIIRIHKNLPEVRYGAELGSIAGDLITFSDNQVVKDSVWSTNDVIFDLGGAAILNYGATKSARHRTNLLKRRQKAWDRKLLPENFGSHLLRGKKANWKWDKSELTDIRTHELYPLIKKYVIPC